LTKNNNVGATLPAKGYAMSMIKLANNFYVGPQIQIEDF
jgi:hypothetical protein